MVDHKTAWEIVRRHIRPFGQEEVELGSALGRTLAGSLKADRDYPPFNRSTMDGYALRLDDLEKGQRHFVVTGTIYAGDASFRDMRPGESYRIMTGAPVPSSADLVVRREDTEENSETIEVKEMPPEGWRTYQNISRRGQDLQAGQPVLGRGVLCTPSVVGLLASLGQESVWVERHPRVALITTGEEVVEVGAPVGASQIRNGNRWLLDSVLRSMGIELSLIRHAKDDLSQLVDLLGTVMDFDIVIISGGVSAGDADLTPGALERVGAKKLFHKISMRPGKPTWCGLTPKGGMIFALPGNPFSCLVNFILLIRPWLQGCLGQEPEEPVGLPLGFAKEKVTPLDEFFPVRLHGMPGRLASIPLNGSGDIRLGLQAGALALHPAQCGDLPVDTPVLCYSLYL
jgi:molybdopterin molybdotransferase